MRQAIVMMSNLSKEKFTIFSDQIAPRRVVTATVLDQGVQHIRAVEQKTTKILKTNDTHKQMPWEGETSGESIFIRVESVELGHRESTRSGTHDVEVLLGEHDVAVDRDAAVGVNIER